MVPVTRDAARVAIFGLPDYHRRGCFEFPLTRGGFPLVLPRPPFRFGGHAAGLDLDVWDPVGGLAKPGHPVGRAAPPRHGHRLPQRPYVPKTAGQRDEPTSGARDRPGAVGGSGTRRVELLLDQYLAKVPAVQETFWGALRMATNTTRVRLLWASPDDAWQFERLRERLLQVGRPNGTASSRRTVERIGWTLERRPRLRLADGDAETLVGWVDGMGHRLAAEWETLLSELRVSLLGRGWPMPLPLT